MISLAQDLVRHRDLAFGLTRRELTAPFAGSAFGVAWVLLHPLAQMLVYLVVFSFIFRIRFDAAEASGFGYPAYVLAGLIPWMTWATVLNNAGNAVLGSAALVRQADFPSQILPVRTVMAAMVPHAVGLAALLVYLVSSSGRVLPGWGLIPLALFVQFGAMLGAATLLSALCVFLRDLREVVVVFTTLGIFLVPAFYTPSMLEGGPKWFAWILEANPFSHFVWIYRDAIFAGSVEHPTSWGVAVGLALVSLLAGSRVFARLRPFFGNLI